MFVIQKKDISQPLIRSSGPEATNKGINGISSGSEGINRKVNLEECLTKTLVSFVH